MKKNKVEEDNSKPVYFSTGTKSCGNAITIKQAKGVAWQKLPKHFKEKIKKEKLEPTEYLSSWIIHLPLSAEENNE
jgi:hypothetical protein